MSDKKSFLVDMIGIPDHERNVLKSIFKLSLYRAYAFIFVSANEPCQILMVDADDPEVMAKWRTRHRSGESTSSAIATVMVTKEKQPDTFPYSIHRPFVATRVLGVLDQIATEISTRSAERAISEEPAAIATKEVLPVSTVLVVDDSSTIRKQLELELKLFDVQVDTAESSEQVFDLMNRKIYDMIFLDVVLPGIDGYQICKIIKKDKDKKKIPVVMLTSKSSPFDRIKGALAGCDTYLTKPVKQASFQKVVKKYLKIP
jgi:twitching motility two-component system response regulator PilG